MKKLESFNHPMVKVKAEPCGLLHHERLCFNHPMVKVKDTNRNCNGA